MLRIGVYDANDYQVEIFYFIKVEIIVICDSNELCLSKLTFGWILLYLYLYKIESLNLLTVCVANANAKHDISYTTGFSMFRRWMLAHYISDFLSVAKIKPRKSYAPDIEE